MKFVLILAICVASAMVAMAKNCDSKKDCEEDECCVKYIFTSECQKYGKQDKPCVPRVADQQPDKYLILCPCEKEFTCINQKTIETSEGIIEYDPRCVTPPGE